MELVAKTERLVAEMITKTVVTSLLVLCLFITPTVVKADELSDLIRKANTSYNHGSYQQTILLLNQALKLEPKNINILSNLGDSFYELGEYSAAITSFSKALSITRII
jgi:tetratricopeptide (TPR) repeat protein